MKQLVSVILLTAFIMAGLGCYSQRTPEPTKLPSPNSTNYYRIGWMLPQKGYLYVNRDTNWTPSSAGAITFWQHTGVDTAYWGWSGRAWEKIGSGVGGVGNVVWSLGFPTYDARYSKLGHTHSFSTLTGKPTTLGGYGIIDAVPNSRTLTINGVTFDLSTNRAWSISVGGTYTGTPPVNITGTVISVDTTSNNKALATKEKVRQLIDSSLAGTGLGFEVESPLAAVNGIGGNPDTLVILDNGIDSTKIAANAIGTEEINNLAVTGAKVANSTLPVGKLSVSGTPDGSKFLRDDGTWATPAGGGGGGGTSNETILQVRTITAQDSIMIPLYLWYDSYVKFKIVCEDLRFSNEVAFTLRVQLNGASAPLSSAAAYKWDGNENVSIDETFHPLFWYTSNSSIASLDGYIEIIKPNVVGRRRGIFSTFYGTNGGESSELNEHISQVQQTAAAVDWMVLGGATGITGTIKVIGYAQ